MAQPIEPGRGRIDYKGDPALVDALKADAARQGVSFTAYLTLAFRDLLHRNGQSVPDVPPPKRRGRPRKGGKK